MEAHAQTILPEIHVTPPVELLDTSWLVSLGLAAVITYLIWFVFRPWVSWKINQLSNARKQWSYWALVGRKVSDHAKRTQVGEELHSSLLNLVQKGVITGKDKRQYIRELESWLRLDRGTLGPKPSAKETKGRIQKRVHSIAKRMASTAQTNGTADPKVVPITRPNGLHRLNGIMSRGSK